MMAAAAVKRSASQINIKNVTISTPTRPKESKRAKDDNEPPIFKLGKFVENSNEAEGSQKSVKLRPAPSIAKSEINRLTADMMDIKNMFKGLATQLTKLDKLDNLEKVITNLSSELAEAKLEIKAVKEENQKLQAEVNAIKRDMQSQDVENGKLKKLEERIIDVQARSTRDNLVFYNLPETESEHGTVTSEGIIKNLIKEKLEIDDNVEFERVHRMGSARNQEGNRKVRPIVAKFSSHKMKERVKFAAKKLQGTQIGISEQFPKEISERRKQLWPLFKAAKVEGRNAKLVVDKLFVDGQQVFAPTTVGSAGDEI